MTIQRLNPIKCVALVLPLIFLLHSDAANAQKKNAYACKEPDPTALCTAANTCSGSCSVDVKRTANGAEAVPGFPGAKGNSAFCAKAGTPVTWKSDTKHQGFVVDMGPKTPFDPPNDIIGGSDKSVTVTAKTPGCYRYSAGACLSGAIYGMCGNGTAEVVILK